MLKLIPAALVALAATAVHAQESTTPALADPPAVTAPSDTTPASPSAGTSATDSTAPMMTDAEANAWINKTVYSSDGKNLGEVSQVVRDSSGKVTELHADIGGFLGIGETRVRIMPSEFKLASDRVILDVAGDQAKNLPKIEK